MADKIVQLVDDQNNNIYPISRGVAANSVDTNAIQDGAVTSDKIDSTTLGKLAYLPGDTITLYGIYMFSTTAAGKVALRFTLPKSLAYVTSVTASNGAVGGTYGFMVDSSRQMSSVNPRLAANQTITGSLDQNMGVLAVFDPDVGTTNLPAYCSGIMTVNGVTLTFS